MTPRDRALSITLENGVLWREDIDQIEAAIIAHAAELEAENAKLNRDVLFLRGACVKPDAVGDYLRACRKCDELEAENARLRAALETIAAWRFDIMGDCVADARRVAQVALGREMAQTGQSEQSSRAGKEWLLAPFVTLTEDSADGE